MATPFLSVPASTRAPTTLYIREGDTYREAPPAEILHHACDVIALSFRHPPNILDTPDTLRTFLRIHLAPREYETFALITLDCRKRLIEYTELFRGTLDRAAVYPREILKETLTRNAAHVILVHNHTSGVARPSYADEVTTRRLKDLLAVIDVGLLDHLIVGEDIYSFAENGLI